MPADSAPAAGPTGATRRTVLHAVGLAALTGGGAAVLGACSPGDGSGTDQSSTATPAASSTPPPDTPPASSAATPSSPRAPVRTPRGPGIAVRDVPVGGGVILNEADYVITQPTEGDFRAFRKFCTHRQCPLASVGGGMINCACHGGRFSMIDGSVQNGPPPGPLPRVEVVVAGDRVVVTD